jgi:hypothetical protein
MVTTNANIRSLLPLANPRLPTAPVEYDRTFVDQQSNTLRLYFNQINNALQQLLLGFNSYGQFYNTTTLTNPVANTVNLATLNTTLSSYGVEVDTVVTSRINLAQGGVYTVTYSVQADITAGANVNIDFWVRKNGVDVAGTSSRIGVVSATDKRVATRMAMVAADPGDYIQIAWASASTSAQLAAFAASAPYPLVPCISVSVQYTCPDAYGV